MFDEPQDYAPQAPLPPPECKHFSRIALGQEMLPSRQEPRQGQKRYSHREQSRSVLHPGRGRPAGKDGRSPAKDRRRGPLAEEVPSGTPSQASLGDVQRGTSPTEQERTGQPDREREEDEGLIDKLKDALLGEEERGREGSRSEDRR